MTVAGNGNGGGDPNGRRATANEQLYELLHVLFKRKRLVIALFLAITFPSVVAMWSRKPVFVAKGKVLIVSDRADGTISPTEIDTLALLRLNEATVNSEVQIIQSRELLEQVVRGLRVASTSGGVVGIANAASNHEAIGTDLLNLTRALRVSPVRASNVIEISYPSPNSAYAAQVVNRVVDEYLAFHAMVHGQKGLASFYDKQGRGLLATMREAEEKLREFSLNEGLVSPAVEIQAAVSALTSLEGDLRAVSSKVAGTEEKLRVVNEQLAEQPTVVKRAQYVGVNPVVNQLGEQLVDRQVDRIALLRKYTDKERRVRDNDEEIAELEMQLHATKRDEPTVVTQELIGPNPVYEARLTEMLRLEAELKEHRARRLWLEGEIARGRRQLVSLKQKGLEFDRLDQEVLRRRALLELFERRQQEASIGEAMDQERLVNVEVIERPKLPLDRPNNPRTPVYLALLSGLVVAFAGAFGAEYLNRTLRFEREVEQTLGVPVLGRIPDHGRA
jgi:succinoglycan biosynthesis transport protein ExoP